VLEFLRAWAARQEVSLGQAGWTIGLIEAPIVTDNPALGVDVDSPTTLGRLMLWASGAVEFETAVIVGNETLRQHRDISSLGDLEVVLLDFLEVLR
jgi:hypothetical protein